MLWILLSPLWPHGMYCQVHRFSGGHCIGWFQMVIYSLLLHRSCISLPVQREWDQFFNVPFHSVRTSFVEIVSLKLCYGGCISEEKSHHSPIWSHWAIPFQGRVSRTQACVKSASEHLGNQASFKQFTWMQSPKGAWWPILVSLHLASSTKNESQAFVLKYLYTYHLLELNLYIREQCTVGRVNSWR